MNSKIQLISLIKKIVQIKTINLNKQIIELTKSQKKLNEQIINQLKHTDERQRDAKIAINNISKLFDANKIAKKIK